MKYILLFLIPGCTSVWSFAQEITYVKGGTVSYNYEILKKPKDILPILEKQNSEELLSSFKKYRRCKRVALLFASLSGSSFAGSISYNTGVPRFDYPFVVAGIATAGIAALFNKPANRALKKVVENYNYNLIQEKYGVLSESVILLDKP